MTRLNQIDMNLLVALDVLLEERHITRSARRLGVTQSAMSQTLQRLRDALGDQLLVKSGGQMAVTPHAVALATPLREALRALERALVSPAAFDAKTATRVFRLAMLDVYSVSILPALLEQIAQAGPGLSLEVVTLDVDTVWEQLQRGEVDMAVIGPRQGPADVVCVPVFRERMVTIARQGHPIFEEELTAQAYCRWPHAIFRITGRGAWPIDQRLEEMGLKRRIVGRSSFFLSAPWVVVQGDTLISLPLSAASAMAKRWPLRIFSVPLRVPIEYDVCMAWSKAVDSDEAHRWFRARVLEIGGQVGLGALERGEPSGDCG
jgi:DNA-binding transcriptional LysR family regulator